MKIYIRKIDNQCVEKQISIPKGVVKDFFHDKLEFEAEELNMHNKELVKILPATDTRFSAEIKHVVGKELEVGDLLVIYENDINYLVELIKTTDRKYDSINELCKINERHSLIFLDKDEEKDETDKISFNRREKYRKWLENTTTFSDATIYNYVRYIDYIKEKGFSDIDLYTTDDIRIIDNIIEKFNSLQDYIQYNEENRRNPSNALFNYKSFLEYEKALKEQVGYNKIYYGAPGTGKSYEIDNVILKDLSKEEKEERVIRITFHPEYTYSDFIGQLIPIIEKDSDGNDKITYDFKIGPFTLALKKSYETKEMIYLVIEEMSRGNCAAIFGDIFQLLDRNKDGESTYDITNDIIAEKVFGNKDTKIKIPTNLTILGTVNTSDQNVYVMDTAFKRRFEWKYIPITPVLDEDESKEYKNNAYIELKNSDEVKKYKWVDFYMALNKFIASNEYLGLGEDKQIGQFFIKFDFEEEKDREKIENKLLHYLWFDIQESSFKSDKKLFSEKISDFGDLFIKYTTNAQIFSNEFFKLLNDYKWEK